MLITVGIIGWFLNKRDNAMVARDAAITSASENLTSAVQQLKEVVISMKSQHETRQPIVDAQLELFRQGFINNAAIVGEIDARLIKLETEHKLFRCNYSETKTKSKKNDITD